MASFKMTATIDADEDPEIDVERLEVACSLKGTESPKRQTFIEKFQEEVSQNERNKCPSCLKTVYKMEELLAMNCIWHKNCFCCGGPVGEGNSGCGRVLTIESHVQQAGLPYCKACFARLFQVGGARGSAARPASFSLTNGNGQINTNNT